MLFKRAASEELDDGHDDTWTSRDKSMPMAPVILCVFGLDFYFVRGACFSVWRLSIANF